MRFHILIFTIFSYCILAQKPDLEIVFDKPATHFTEALPLGNGRLGVLVYGDFRQERISLNEISLWSGGKQDADLDTAYTHLKSIQNLLLEYKNKEAQAELMKHFVAKGVGSGYGRGANEKYGCYQTAGNFRINWNNKNSDIQNYTRVLDLETATSTTSYTRDGVPFRQEVFTDFQNDVILIKIESQKPLPDFSIYFERQENIISNSSNGNEITMRGQLPSGKDLGMLFLAKARVLQSDGTIENRDKELIFKNVSQCILAIDIQTDYDNLTGNLQAKKDLDKESLRQISALQNIDFQKLKSKSIKHYQSYFKRNELRLNHTEKKIATTTPQRLINFQKGKQDADLVALYYNFGRYLFISSSREGLLPANLQGLWAEEYQTPWNGDYHLNINLQMNYWAAENTNLSDLAEPLFRFTGNLVENGKKTAKKYYNANGWVAHVISNPWFFTSPGEGAEWGSTLTGGAWLATHIWEHYRFTKDKKFLRNYYPILKGSAQFLESILIHEKKNGWLVTAPSNSPENTYITPDGFYGNTCLGPTMDMQICRNIFSAVIEASDILNIDKDFAQKLRITKNKLAPNQISKRDGGVQEWLDDWASAEPQHRHTSHLFGLYPYDEITSETPQLFEAARKTLDLRGDGGTGWSKAWKINFWARLHDGNRAYKMIKELLTPVYQGKNSAGGTYSNLFDAYPPFQIDGNFGATSGIAEMLLQSHGKGETIRFIPALPRDIVWKSGSMKGMKARNNFEISFAWDNYSLTNAEVISMKGGVCRVQIPSGKKLYKNGKLQITKASNKDHILNINTKTGDVLQIKSVSIFSVLNFS